MSKGHLHEGLKRHNPPGVDSSMKPPKGSVDSNTTRSATAKTPKTLGPRTTAM